MNYYEILEINKKSTTEEIKKHYYKLAKKYHPDKSNNSTKTNIEKFKYLSEAYSVLSNPKKRYLYDLELLMKKLNIINDNFNFKFTDEELILLHNYYSKFMNSTEIKFLKLLYENFPENIRNEIKKKIFKYKSYNCISTKNIKYIDITELKNNYTIFLKRNLKDVFFNVCKQIIIKTRNNIYYLYITHSDYQIDIFNIKNSILTIKIETYNNDYHINGNDLYLTKKITLYDYYFENINIKLPDNKIYYFNDKKLENYKINNYGLKNFNNKRGNMYVCLKLNLDIPNIIEYKKDIYNIFNNVR